MFSLAAGLLSIVGGGGGAATSVCATWKQTVNVLQKKEKKNQISSIFVS